MTFITEIMTFLLKYWVYLTLVAGTLLTILIIAAILNLRNRIPATPQPNEPFDKKPSILPAQPEPTIETTPEPEPIPVSEPQPVILTEPVPVQTPSPLPLEVPVVELPAPEPVEPPKPKKPLGKYHVMFRPDGKWIVKREGSTQILRVLETQREAISWATIKALTLDVGIVVHQKDGKIRKNPEK